MAMSFLGSSPKVGRRKCAGMGVELPDVRTYETETKRTRISLCPSFSQ